MPVNKSEEFNYSLYKNLLLEDKKLIDEYIPKMMTGEVNSFMKRLIEHYKTQEDILEVNEEIDFIDFVEVFENYKNTDIKKKIAIDKALPIIYKSFYTNSNNLAAKYLFDSIISFFSNECSDGIDLNIIDMAKIRIREIYTGLIKNNEKFVRIIKNIRLSLCPYTYRITNNMSKVRMGIALNKSVLIKTRNASAGYSHNFKLDKKFVNIILDDLDISSFIKKISYWQPKNSKLHGFDNKTGIIWIDSMFDGKTWKLPNDRIIDSNSKVIVSAVCLTDSFFKMFQRLNFDIKMREIILALE